MKINQNIKDLITLWFRIYLLFCGSFWIILHLYLRFGLKRSGYALSEIKNHLMLKHYIIFSFFVILHVILIITAIIILIKRNKEINTSSLFYQIGNKISIGLNKLYWEPLEYINNLIAPHVPGSARFF